MRLKGGLGDDTYLQEAMDASSRMLAKLNEVDLGPRQYHLKVDQLSERMFRLSCALEQRDRIELNLNNEATFFNPSQLDAHGPQFNQKTSNLILGSSVFGRL